MHYRGTREVAQALGVSHSRLARAVWTGKVREPERGPGGAFLWTDEDIERASWVLLGKSPATVAKGQRGQDDD